MDKTNILNKTNVFNTEDIIDVSVIMTGGGLTQKDILEEKNKLLTLRYELVRVDRFDKQSYVDFAYTFFKVKPVNIESKIVSIVKHKAIIENLTYGKIYGVLSFDKKSNCYNIIDDSGKYSTYHKDYFLSLSKWEEYFPKKKDTSNENKINKLKNYLQSNYAMDVICPDRKLPSNEITYYRFESFTIAETTIDNNKIYGVTKCIKPDRFSINKGKLYAFKNLVHVLIAMEQSDDYKFYN